MIETQTFWHIKSDNFPRKVKRAVSILYSELSIPKHSSASMCWCVSSDYAEVSGSDKEFNAAYNVLNKFLLTECEPKFNPGCTVYID